MSLLATSQYQNYGTCTTTTAPVSFPTKRVDACLAMLEGDQIESESFQECFASALDEIQSAKDYTYGQRTLTGKDKVAVYKYDQLQEKVSVLSKVDATLVPYQKSTLEAYLKLHAKILKNCHYTADSFAQAVLSAWNYYDVTVIQGLDWISKQPIKKD